LTHAERRRSLAALSALDSTNAMKPHCSPSAPPAGIVPPALVDWMSAFRDLLTAPVWNRVLVLVAGAVLATGKRTVSQALRVMGLEAEPDFARYHAVLNRARWSSRLMARRLLVMILDRFLPEGEVVLSIDDTIERRWGAKITARGIYRDPVRSSHGHFVKASGLRWLSLMAVVPVPWTMRRWALPFLTVLAPSERWSKQNGRRHKKLTDWARQAILQAKRWLPGRRIIVVADQSFAALDLIAAVRRHVCLVTRLRLDANLYAPAALRRPGQRGRPRVKGPRLPKLAQLLAAPSTTQWSSVVIDWYGGEQRWMRIASGTAIWHHSGLPPAAIRWVLVRDPYGERDPQAFLSTDLDARPLEILSWFVQRWTTETTFEEVRQHLGVETQRQWSDLAILRTTPALLALFSLVTIWSNELVGAGTSLRPLGAAWYAKSEPSFSDAIALVRRALWAMPDFSTSRRLPETIEIPAQLWKRLVSTLCHAT
jgi:DDE superfamily endonuclease